MENGKTVPREKLSRCLTRQTEAWLVKWQQPERKKYFKPLTPQTRPWNFPASMVTRKISPAIAAGCPVILKPAEQTPFCAVEIIKLAHEAGIPKGVISLLAGPPEIIGDTLLEDSRVRKITFTGSTAVGKMLMKKSADTVKHISLELGGHAPYIVFDDANLDKAVSELMGAKNKKLRTGLHCHQQAIRAGIH